MLTLLENMKHQMNQLSTMVNLLLSRSNNAASEPTSEMPDDIPFPLHSLDEVDFFEDWLEDPANAIKQKNMVSYCMWQCWPLLEDVTRSISHGTFLHKYFQTVLPRRLTGKGSTTKRSSVTWPLRHYLHGLCTRVTWQRKQLTLKSTSMPSGGLIWPQAVEMAAENGLYRWCKHKLVCPSSACTHLYSTHNYYTPQLPLCKECENVLNYAVSERNICIKMV
ncbi:hypothetical protein GJAV_G00077990 [Gymnothorax javanicus]|nr:hypothetical protein GJAV_G00077990 [Gymnothorax javanicus]